MPFTIEPGFLKEIRFETFTAGGPGGQHANRTYSGVRAVHVPTGLTAVARERRSQFQNRELAIQRLITKIKARRRPVKPRLPTTLPRNAKEQRLKSKEHRSRLKGDRKRVIDSE